MKTRISALLLLAACLWTPRPAAGQERQRVEQPDSVQMEIEALAAQLEAAYRELFPTDARGYSPRDCFEPEEFRSPLLDDFLETWHRRYAPTEAADRQRSDTLATIYDLFADLSRPEMEIKVWYGQQAKTVGHYRYVTVPEKFHYAVFDEDAFEKSLEKGEFIFVKYATLTPFRPEIPYGKSLYITYPYACALDRFLGNQTCATDHMNNIPSLDEGEYWRRGDFIYNNLPIGGGHWGGWLYEAEPRCFSILLNASLDRAIIDVGRASTGTQGLYRKTAGKWLLERELCQWVQ